MTFQVTIGSGGLWDRTGGGRHWRSETAGSYRKAWGRYLRFLHETDRLDIRSGMCDRVTEPLIEAYYTFMKEIGLSARSVCGEVASLHNLIYCAYPGHELTWLREVLARLEAIARSEVRMDPALVRIDLLLEAGMTAMRQADQAPSSRHLTGGASPDLAPSIDYRDALMVALLAVTLVRRRNFAALTIGTALLKQDGRYVVRLDRNEVKNHRPIEFEVYPRLTPYIDHYLTHHRPRLLQGRHSNQLWCSAYGEDLRPNRINEMIKRFTHARFGIALSPHKFRTCAASSVAELAPELVRIIQSLLAHSGPRTAEIYYNKVQMTGASRRHGGVIEKLRSDLRLAI